MIEDAIQDEARKMLDYYTPDISAENIVNFLEKRLGCQVSCLFCHSANSIKDNYLYGSTEWVFSPYMPITALVIFLADANGREFTDHESGEILTGYIAKDNSSDRFQALLPSGDSSQYFKPEVFEELAEKMTAMLKTN